MVDQLATVFNSLRKENGEPDEEARRLELDSLLRHLTLSEIRRIRVQLSSKPVLDACDLPSELITRIFAQIPLADLFTLRRVSRKWRGILSSSEFCHEMIKKHFGPQWKLRSKNIMGINDDGITMEWFQHSAIARVKRQRGQYHSMLIYWHGFSQQEPQGYHEYQYSNGRLGLRYSNSMILVKSFCSTCVDRFYMDENREPIKEWLLSDNYLIGLKPSPPALLAWPLETNSNGQPYHTRLPSKIASMSASQSRVAAVTTSQEVLIWTIGGPLRALNWSKTKQSWSARVVVRVEVIFDLDDTNLLYLVCERRSEPDGQDVTFTIDQYYKSIWKSSHSRSFIDDCIPRREPKFTLLEESAIGISNIDGLLPVHNQLQTANRNSDGESVVVQLVFDICSNRFETRYYALPPPVDSNSHRWAHYTDVYQFWRGQILVPIHGSKMFDDQRTDERENMGETEIPDPQYKPEGMKEAVLVALNPSPTLPNNAPVRNSIAYFWIGGAKEAQHGAYNHERLTNNWSQKVMGDDTFTILCGRYGYMVWSFDKDIELSRDNLWEGHLPAPYEDLHPLGMR